MIVTVKHSELKEGMISKTTFNKVDVDIQFTDSELAVLNNPNLADTVVLKRDAPVNSKAKDINNDLTFKWLVDGRAGTVCGCVADARNYETELVESLKKVKRYIEYNNEEYGKTSKYEI